jgi:hypothetical protein
VDDTIRIAKITLAVENRIFPDTRFSQAIVKISACNGIAGKSLFAGKSEGA